jgi:ribonuclease Y
MADAVLLVSTAAGALAVGALAAALVARRSGRERVASEVAQERARLDAEQRAAVGRLEERSSAALTEARASLEATIAAERRQLEDARRSAAEHEARTVRREQQIEGREQALGTREQALIGREQALGERERAAARAIEAAATREERLRSREETATRRDAELERAEGALAEREQGIAAELARVAGLDREQARAELLKKVEEQLGAEMAARIARHEKDLLSRLKEQAVEHLSRAIQRYAAEHTAEHTATRIQLASEDAKGRIIGREGRNIKAFEQATGVDVIIDEAPDAIAISCFDPVRREMARRALVRLLDDGRIHPGRIEEVMAAVQQELDRELVKMGEDAAYHCEISGLHPQLIKLLGKLHFRTSYGQNVLKHTQEVAFLCASMAADLGLDPKLARRCGLLHDIGKAIDHEQEGSHPQLGYEALKRYGESEVVANAALAHHEGQAVLSAYTVLAAAADAISAARPGARYQSAENFVKRLQQLELIACSTPGVQKAYAIQAGRELRVIINAHSVPDLEMPKVARDIARRIEEQVTYPGEVRVTLIRELRQVAVAR